MCVGERKIGERGRNDAKKKMRRGRPKLAVAAFPFDMLATPGSAFASEHLELSAVQVGTLPLLAALGIGIVVAVGAVIAFLQMTARGKAANSVSAADDEEPLDERGSPEWNGEEASAEEELDDEPSITDYTIPVTQIVAFQGQAETAEDDEPRLCGLEGEHAGNSYRVLNRRLTFGRDPSRCTILFPYEAGEISRVHCTLRYSEENRLFILEDNGSSNGTFLASGERLKPGVRYALRSGERFSLSGNRHLFVVRDETAAPVERTS
ncbi:FHA domain-containing protein [Paenibacillaceae bacterium WGS1546]|uniref:FHA domain-containing protein n=1 Tax=Cohnella sp. WGS1546 TaxID=3366810 RepID=UPI00372D7F44